MRKDLVIAVLASALFVLVTGMPAHADVVTFDFNTLASGRPATNGTNTATSSIQGYMNSVLGVGRSVAVSYGAITDQAYDGDDHVTGPVNGSVRSMTLGTSDGATNGTTPTPTGTLHASDVYDTFVRNRSGQTSFSFTFTGFPIYGVSFDYEIFPDGNCANGDVLPGRCNSNWPDFKFEAGTGSTSQVFRYFGVMPGDATSTPETKWSETLGWWSYSASPADSTESAPQLLGTWDGVFASPVTTLTFRDWPATIGIDNLVIHTPEPGSIVLLGTFLLASLGALRRKFRAK